MNRTLCPTRLLVWSLACLCACDGEQAKRETGPAPRPVTVITTAISQPETSGRIIGVAKPYRQDQIAFEVGGRVMIVEDLGKELRGPTLDDDDRVIAGQEGEAIARIETTRYDQVLRTAELSLSSARKGLAAQRIEAHMAATSQLAQAEANEKIAEQDFVAAESNEKTAKARLARMREQFALQIASQAQLDSEQSAYASAAATLESARQAVLSASSALATAQSQAQVEQAQVEQTLAEIAELEQRVRNANQDLADCTLVAPFSGRITDVHAGRGGVVQAGTPIITLTAMNPMQVSVTVSAERSRSLIQGEQVALYPRELDRYTDDPVLYGVVFGKAEVADAATRTYRIDIMVRNLRRSRTPREVDGKPIYAVEQFMPVMHAEPGGSGPLFIGVDCLHEDGGKQYVYRLPGMAGFDRRLADLDTVLRPERIEVQVKPGRLTFINFKFVRIADGSSLAEGDALIRDPRPEHIEGITLERYDWSIRPGDLVPVSLDLAKAPLGVYVPVDAISSLNGRQSVFVVEGDRCRRTPITVHESAANLRRIEGEGIAAGLRLVREGAHYLADGDSVVVVDSIF